jgi:hypothetical protein
MTWWMKILAIWAPFVVIALLVIAVAAANAWMERRSERERWYEATGETGKHSAQALRDRLAEVPAAPRHDQPLALAQPPPQPASYSPQPAQPAPTEVPSTPPPEPPAVSTAELRLWARQTGLRVADRGPVPAHVREAWLRAQQIGEPGASPRP